MTWYFDSTTNTQAIVGVHFDPESTPANIHEVTDDAHSFITDPAWLAPDGAAVYGYLVEWSGTDVVRTAITKSTAEKATLKREEYERSLKTAAIDLLHTLARADAPSNPAALSTYIYELQKAINSTDTDIVANPAPVLTVDSLPFSIESGETVTVWKTPLGLNFSKCRLEITHQTSIHHMSVSLAKLSDAGAWSHVVSDIHRAGNALLIGIDDTNGHLAITNNETETIYINTAFLSL